MLLVRWLNWADRNDVFHSEVCDFVAFARPFLVDSSFVVKSRNNENYKPCLGCRRLPWLKSNYASLWKWGK